MNNCFLVALCRANLEVATKRLLHQQVKVVLVPCCIWKYASTSISGSVCTPLVPVCHLLRLMGPL